MFAICNRGALWEDMFETVEDAKDYAEMYCRDWEVDDFKDFMIVEIVPRTKVYIPPKRLVWKEV